MKRPVIFLSGREAFSAKPDFTAMSVITINGNSEGSTHSAHIINPSRQQETYLSG